MEQRRTDIWYRESAASPWLQPLSWVYGLVVRGRRLAYATGWLRTRRADRPVIVVGNLTVGGTGKTPLVAWLASQLSAAGLKVGIVSRGYGSNAAGVRIVTADSNWRDVGDEPVLLRKLTGCDIVVARDRYAGAQALVAGGVDVIIADDGLQHLRLARDCEIVVIDGARGFGNGGLLPAGPLREPTVRLGRADLIVMNGVPEHVSLLRGEHMLPPVVLQMTLSGDEAYRLDGSGVSQPLERFRGGRIHAVAGIGNPLRFFRSLRAHGLEVIEHAFADHHPFVAADLSFPDGLPVLMTEKDAVRCRSLADARFWYVPVTARFDEIQARQILERIAAKLKLGD
jgi:tetraacyldisaccharide 4'-kinase